MWEDHGTKGSQEGYEGLRKVAPCHSQKLKAQTKAGTSNRAVKYKGRKVAAKNTLLGLRKSIIGGSQI